jgi:hypothetical protein
MFLYFVASSIAVTLATRLSFWQTSVLLSSQKINVNRFVAKNFDAKPAQVILE